MTTWTEQDYRQEMVEIAHLAAEQGLLRSNDGNISARLEAGRFLVTPSGIYRRRLRPEQLLVVDSGGQLLSGLAGLRPTTELQLHLEVYRQRPDAGAVLHAHPSFATALTVAELPFPDEMLPEGLAGLGEVPTAPYASPGTRALAQSICDLAPKHNSILLSHHGSLTIGKTLEETLLGLERLEQVAQMFFIARLLGKVVLLPPDEVARLRELARRL